MQLSNDGFDALDQEEGDVLRAYLDIAGVWTISRGLTAASGVVTPKSGMVITQAESDRLTKLALARNYEPAVAKTMGTAVKQNEFDAGVLFHWNTGAISYASWVALWRKQSWAAAETAFKSWRKSDGKVVGALVSRRAREWDMLRYGTYPARVKTVSATVNARIVAPVVSEQVPNLRLALERLGYAVGSDPNAILVAALRQFQTDHGLTADGILGRATAATIQRRVDAARKGETAAAFSSAGVFGGAAQTATGTGADPAFWLGPLLIVAGIAWAACVAWQYRDAIAAKVQTRLPRLAAYLRSF